MNRDFDFATNDIKNCKWPKPCADCDVLQRLLNDYAEMFHLLQSIDRRAGLASRQSALTDSLEVAEWARGLVERIGSRK